MLRQSDIAANLFKDDGIHPDHATGGWLPIVFLYWVLFK